MARRPFACLLAVAALALALVLALLALAFPAPLAAVADRCARGGGLCLGLMRSGRMLGGPVLLALLPWSLWLGASRAWRLGRATGAAVTTLSARGAAPSGALRDLCAGLGLAGRVVVVEVDAPLAMCVGLARPRILISRGALARLGPEELVAVLCHERVHLRHRHPLQLLVAAALAAALPFLPLLRELAGALPRAQELAADRAVIRAGRRRALGRAVLALLTGREEVPVLPLAAGVVGVLDARLDQLAGDAVWVPPIARRTLLLTGLVFAAALLALGVLGLAAGPGAPAGTAPALAHLSLPWHCLLVATGCTAVVRALGAVVAHVRRARAGHGDGSRQPGVAPR